MTVAVVAPARRAGVLWWAVPLLLAIVAAAAIGVAVAGRSEPPVPAARYVVPAGTGAAMDAGNHVAVLPATIVMRQGVELVIVNQDDRPFDLGPFVIGPGQTFRRVMADKGTFRNTCRLAPGGDVTFVVF